VTATAVLYVHGLWMPGLEGFRLQQRLQQERGFEPSSFRYASMRDSLADTAAALRDRIAAIEAPQVHLVGHSMGGLVILECLQRYPMRQPGRVVLLGTPAAGSYAARRLARWGWGRRLLGRAIAELLPSAGARRWESERELGIIAGHRSMGMGRLLLGLRFDGDNDGTVAVAETRLAGAKQSLSLPVTHSGMLFSAAVARETGSFLQYGRFGH
jgi:pimeloyl-ACP methyl ester carboxylesterase